MALPQSIYLEKLAFALTSAEIGQSPVEVHGALIGLIAGGMQEKQAWQKPLVELINDGQPLTDELTQLIQELHQDAYQRLADFEFGFQPLLPEEEESLARRVEALSLWTHSFLTGLAMMQPKLKQASPEVQEIMQDLAEISRVELDISEDEESEAAYLEILEFVRMSAILCYSEFNVEPQVSEKKTLH